MQTDTKEANVYDLVPSLGSGWDRLQTDIMVQKEESVPRASRPKTGRKTMRPSPPNPAKQRIQLILDTDIGGDIDDTWALAMIFGCPQLDLRLVTTAFDDTYAKARLVAKMLGRTGCENVPVGVGVRTSDCPLYQAAWLGDYDLDSFRGVVLADGVSVLIEAVHNSPTPPVILAIGPLRNLAEALRRDPSIADRARVVAMAGGVRTGYGPASAPEPECNIVSDIGSARAVLAAPWDVTLVPLDACNDVRLKGDAYRAVVDSPSPWAKVVIENYDTWALRSQHPADSSSILFDTVAAYAVFDDSLFVTEDIRLSVDDRGVTVPDPGGKLCHCLMGWRDYPAFERFLVKSLQ